jgi:hypothetical protein
VSPTALGLLPSNLPIPNQQVQIKRGASGVDLGVNNTIASGTKLQDGVGGLMQISYTPRYPCYWLVRANSIWRGYDGGWQRCDHGIYVTPADLDGVTFGHQRCVNCYDQNVVQWRTHASSCMFRLAAGITYTAYLAFVYSSGYNQQYHGGTGWHRIFGVVLGEGEV